MRLARLPLLAAALLLAAGDVQAQGFFERLFGLAPARPAPPSASHHNAPAPDAPPGGEDPQRRPAAPPVQARPVSMRVPTEDGLIGRELKQNGSTGSLRLERTGGSDLRVRLTLVGRRSAQSVETCTVAVNNGQAVGLTFQGRPEGVQRYQLQDASCPLTMDILDEAVLIKGPRESCTFQAASCLVEAAGMWGPEPNQLLPRARDYEAARGQADKNVRENYKALVQRSRPENVRPVVSEQAAFSSDREMLCRTYARESSHSFCNARFSEARVISLAQRLGVAVASNQPAPAEPRPRRRSDSFLSPAEELVQGGRPFPID